METLEEKIKKARVKVCGLLQLACPAGCGDDIIEAAEAFLWNEGICTRLEQSSKRLSELPDEVTVGLYTTRAADKNVLSEAVLRAMAQALDKRVSGSIGQRVRARSRIRQESKPKAVPPTTIETDTIVKGKWTVVQGNMLLMVAWCFLIPVLVVYVVERTKQ
jgi:hypothetical protein